MTIAGARQNTCPDEQFFDEEPLDERAPDPSPLIQGVTAGETVCDIDELIEQLGEEYERLRAIKLKSHNQRIAFRQRVVGIAYVADAHLGHKGVNLKRLLDEARLIVRTPNLWMFTVGDMIENMILAKLVNSRLNIEIEPTKEWELLKYYLVLVAGKLLGNVPGNHLDWLMALTGIPFFQEAVRVISPQALYDTNDIRFTLSVGRAEFPIRLRHKWRYKTKYNDSHGIEDMCRFDSDFVCGVGAHYHSSGLVREFDCKGGQGVAVVCGSYKDIDEYPAKLGMPMPNGSTAVTVLYFDNGKMLGVSDLELAADILEFYNRR